MSNCRLKPLLPFPALLIEDGAERTLVIADLHLGWEASLIEKGIHLPSQVSRLQTKLLQLIELSKPERIIFLGDLKQTISRISFEEWRSIPAFLELIQKSVNEISVILGNHDGNLEPLTTPSIKIFSSRGIAIGKDTRIGLFHGHAWPSPEVLACDILVMGHIHPVFWFRDRMGLWTVQQVWIKACCDSHKLAEAYLKHFNIKTTNNPPVLLEEKFKIELKEPKLVVMPAFNELIGGVSLNGINRRLIGPLLNSESIKINDAELYLLDGTYIGTVEQVRSYFSE